MKKAQNLAARAGFWSGFMALANLAVAILNLMVDYHVMATVWFLCSIIWIVGTFFWFRAWQTYRKAEKANGIS